jgi:hypothetical protein
MVWPLFATFTVKNFEDSSPDFVREMRRSFGQLRRLRWWLQAVRGGVASIEVTNIGNGWHPHLHAVLDCRFLSVRTPPPAPALAAEKKKAIYKKAAREVDQQWSLCCGRAGGIKVKRAFVDPANPQNSISREVFKYSVKGSDLVECEGSVSQLIRQLDNCRLMTSFGTMYGRLREFDQPKNPMGCECCGATAGWMPEMVYESLAKPAKKRR